jgi:DNA polymerase-3 subunit gamma/tau
MSYIVLARKYRPLNFEQMVGQEHVVQALSNALTQQRLHHAYLFTGTRGVGKTTVSRILAKSLNCTGADGSGGITAHPCGRCDACRDIDSGRFVDYVELDAASNRGVEEISQLLDQAVYKPVVGRFKVYMIDEVHMLSTTAFNAMLKTLEEPPEYLKFVLATTDPQKVPVTVLSRCLQFNLRPMAPETVLEHLQRVLEAEAIAAEPGALRLLARAARGSMRDALSLTDQAIAFGAGKLEESGVRQMLGAVDRSHVVRIVEALAAGDGPALLATVDALRSMGLSAAGALEELAGIAQQMAVLQAVPDAANAADPETPTLQRLAGLLPADETQLLYSIAIHGRGELSLAPDEYSGLVMVLLRLLAFKPQGERPQAAPPMRPVAAAKVGTASPVAQPAQALHRPAPAPAPLPQAAPRTAALRAPTAPSRSSSAEIPPWVDAAVPDDAAAAGAPGPAAAAEIIVPRAQPRAAEPAAPAAPALSAAELALGDRWAALVRSLIDAGAIGALVRELAMQGQCVAIEQGDAAQLWRLRVERETLRGGTHRERLEAAMAKSLGHAVKLELEAGAVADTPFLRDMAERERRQRAAEELIQNDPMVLSLMQQFKTARIVPGSIKPL